MTDTETSSQTDLHTTSDSLRIVYDGEALRDGSMDVRDLAPALLALGDLFEAANRELYGENAKIAVRVKADIKHKCFDVTIGVAHTWLHHILHAFGSDSATALNNLMTILGFKGIVPTAMAGLLGLFLLLKKRKIKSVKQLSSGNTEITANDGNVIVVNNNVYNLWLNPSVGISVDKLVRPLLAEGIDSLKICHNGNVTQEIKKDEAEWFVNPDRDPLGDILPEEVTTNPDLRMSFVIESADFSEGKKWRLNTGDGNSVKATILDSDFQRRVDAHVERFGKDDYLVCRVTMNQYKTLSGNLKTEYIINKVEEHIPAAKQVAFDWKKSDSPDGGK